MTFAPASWTYAYLVLSLALLLVWLVLYSLRPDLRHRMFRVSLGTAILKVIEPLFAPKDWNPYTVGHRTPRSRTCPAWAGLLLP